MKKLITTLSAIIVSLSIYTFQQSQTDKIITEQFKVIQSNQDTFQAVNINHTADKLKLYFSTDDIQGESNISINDTITAYYVETGAEDTFYKVTKGK